MEGVMMRGPRTWAVAVRTPEGEIEVVTHDAPTWAERWAKMPDPPRRHGARRVDVARLQGARVVGRPPAPRRGAHLLEGDGLDDRRSRSRFFTAHLHPGARARHKRLGNVFGVDGFCVPPRSKARMRLAIFLGYLVLIGLLPDIKRVFQYHGAEHKAIAAYENDVELTAESAQRFTTEHVRCGTNFLLTVMVVTIFVYSFVGRPALARC